MIMGVFLVWDSRGCHSNQFIFVFLCLPTPFLTYDWCSVNVFWMFKWRPIDLTFSLWLFFLSRLMIQQQHRGSLIQWDVLQDLFYILNRIHKDLSFYRQSSCVPAPIISSFLFTDIFHVQGQGGAKQSEHRGSKSPWGAAFPPPAAFYYTTRLEWAFHGDKTLKLNFRCNGYSVVFTLMGRKT